MNEKAEGRRVRPGAEPVYTVGEFVARERAALARFAGSSARTSERMLLIDWQTMFDQHEQGSTASPALSLRSRVRVHLKVLIELVRWHVIERWRSHHLLLTLDAFLEVEHRRLEALVEAAGGEAARRTEDEWYHRLFALPAGPATQ